MKKLIIVPGILLGLALLSAPSAKTVFAAAPLSLFYPAAKACTRPQVVKIYTMPQLEELVRPKTWLKVKITDLVVSTTGRWGRTDGRNLTVSDAFKKALWKKGSKDNDYTILKVSMIPGMRSHFSFWFFYIESSELK